MTLEELVLQAVERELVQARQRPQQRIKLPLLRSKEPGVLNLSGADVEELLT